MRQGGTSTPAGFRRAMAVAGIGMAVAAAATSRAFVVARPTSSHRAGAYPDVAALRQAPARWRGYTALQEGRAAFEGQSDAPADRLDRGYGASPFSRDPDEVYDGRSR